MVFNTQHEIKYCMLCGILTNSKLKRKLQFKFNIQMSASSSESGSSKSAGTPRVLSPLAPSPEVKVQSKPKSPKAVKELPRYVIAHFDIMPESQIC